MIPRTIQMNTKTLAEIVELLKAAANYCTDKGEKSLEEELDQMINEIEPIIGENGENGN